MPIMRHYDVEVEVTVRIKERNGNVAELKVVKRAKASSYEPDGMITPVVQALIEESGQNLWDHTLLVEKSEFSRK